MNQRGNKLIGCKVRIVSDNENYSEYLNKTLKITHADNKGLGYDNCCFPESLCDLQDIKTGEIIPFALYEYEFTKI